MGGADPNEDECIYINRYWEEKDLRMVQRGKANAAHRAKPVSVPYAAYETDIQ